MRIGYIGYFILEFGADRMSTTLKPKPEVSEIAR